MSQKNKTPSMWGIELSKLWLESKMPFPIDPSEIAYEISKVRFEDKIAKIHGHDVAGIEGMLYKSQKANEWFILYDQTIEVSGRIKFTISHELGHYLLHRASEDQFKCGQTAMMQYDSPESVLKEKEANEFASFLLMPIQDFRDQISGHDISLDLIRHCAERYDVSITACALKWIQFTHQVAVVVVARDDFVLWSYPSKSARKLGIYLTKGTELPKQVLEDLASGSKTNRSIRRSAGVWHPEHESAETMIVSDKYELGIFLVRFPLADANEFHDEQEYDSLDIIQHLNQGFTKK